MNDRAENLASDRRWRREWLRRVGYFLLLLTALGLGYVFVRWLQQGVGVGRIGEFYDQADELAAPE